MRAEQLFLQFRVTGDPASLGAVFDLCADELFAVAMHVCRDRPTAEDAVQATFLIAIERAQRYTPGRPLRPWLLGILHREVKRARRRARRVPDAARVRQVDELQPPQVVLAGEAAAAVRDAIANVAQPYRDVLELHLVQALPPASIADRLQRSPGTVRTQLWRGLELLRRLLPKGLALAAAVELGSRPALAAVRERVVTAGRAKGAAAGAGVTVVFGGLLMKQVMLGAAALVAVGLLCWQLLPRPDVAAPVVVPDGARPVAAAIDEGERAPAVEQRAVSRTEAAPVVRPEAAPAEIGPVMVDVLVADGNGKPVPEADVAVYDAKAENADQRASGDARQRVVTDVLGRCRVEIAGPSLLSARKDGVGWSGDLMTSPWRATREGDWYVVLLPTATVRGTVLQCDGRPAVGAVVSAHSSQWVKGQSGELPSMHSDEHGRFECQVLSGKGYLFRARLDGNYASLPGEVELEPGEVSDVVLQFPGAFAVTGTLLDSERQPLAGKIWLLGADSRVTKSATSDAEGHFCMLLTAGGSFDLVGGVEGQTSAHTTLVLDDVRPRPAVTLRTSPFVPVSGRVVDERGEPCAGAFVGLGYVVQRDRIHEQRSSLHGGLPRGPTADDGTFSFLAPAGYRYQVVCQALPGNRELWVEGPEFAAPAQGLSLVLREADKQGFVLSGTVVADADGAAVPRVTVSVITFHESGLSSSYHSVGKGENGAFEVGPMAIGRHCSFVIEADGFARTLVGPFDTTVRREIVDVRLRRCGKVQVRVLRADGTPAIKVRCNLLRLVDDPFGRAWQGETDSDGCIEFADVPPEAFKVQAGLPTQWEERAVGDTIVKPGQTSEVLLMLRQ